VFDLKGRCHCGNISIHYKTRIPPEEAALRACQCTFCRKHQARAVSDPDGQIDFRVARPADLQRYQFGLRSAQFLVCRECGVYVGAFAPEHEAARGHATLMVNVLDDEARYGTAQPALYDAEDAQSRTARRRRVWTPATLTTD
jgi:hypothetical protein